MSSPSAEGRRDVRPDQVLAAYDWSRAHRVPIQMRYADLDPLNHLNNVVYAQYFETARVLLGQALGVSEMAARSVIARQELDYRREVRWGQNVMVELLIERVGHTSWVAIYRLLADGEPCAYGRSVQVLVGEGGMQPQPISDELRARLSDLLAQVKAQPTP